MLVFEEDEKSLVNPPLLFELDVEEDVLIIVVWTYSVGEESKDEENPPELNVPDCDDWEDWEDVVTTLVWTLWVVVTCPVIIA